MAGPDHLDARQVQAASRHGVGPFLPDQVALAIGTNAFGAALVFTGWWAASGSASASDQLAWTNVAVAGLLVAGVGNGVLLARARRTVVLARTSIFSSPRFMRLSGPITPPNARRRFASRTEVRPSVGDARRSRAIASNGTTLLAHVVAVPGTKRFHRVGCPMVAGKQVHVAAAADLQAAGQQACEVCRP